MAKGSSDSCRYFKCCWGNSHEPLLGKVSLSGYRRRKMSSNKKGFLHVLSALCLSISICGCASHSYRTHSEFEMRVKDIGKPVLIVSGVRIYEVSPGAIVELRDDWCAIGKRNLGNAVLARFREKHYNIKPLTMSEEIAKEMEGIQALYRAVSRSIQLHTYGPQLFPERIRNFDYSFGPIEALLERLQADSLILVSALGQISANGSKGSISLSVADSSGTILWYSVKGSTGEYDLRDPKRVLELVEDMLSSFPGASG
jgi:hypothetical protein